MQLKHDGAAVALLRPIKTMWRLRMRIAICGIEFNVAADLLAKQALQDSRQIAKTGSPPPDELCPRQDYRAFLEHKVRQIAATEWITLNIQTRPASNRQALPWWRLHGVRGTSLSADKAQSMLKDSRSYM